MCYAHAAWSAGNVTCIAIIVNIDILFLDFPLDIPYYMQHIEQKTNCPGSKNQSINASQSPSTDHRLFSLCHDSSIHHSSAPRSIFILYCYNPPAANPIEIHPTSPHSQPHHTNIENPILKKPTHNLPASRKRLSRTWCAIIRACQNPIRSIPAYT